MATKKEEPKAVKKETTKKTATKKKAVKKTKEVDEVIFDAGDADVPEKAKIEEKPKTLGSFKDNTSTKTHEIKEAEMTKEDIQGAKPWREYKEGESAQEMGDRLQKEADEHKKKMEKITSVEELDKLEKEMLDVLDEFDKYIKQKKYKLPKSVMFDGVMYTKEQVGVRIARALNKKEVTWQYSLGLYQLHKLWSNIRQFATIPYDAYDSTVRILGDIQFKGQGEWKDILIINEFFVNPNKEFYKDSTMLIYYSTIHSQILERKQMLSPVKSEKTTEVEGAMREVK